jgi:hypothetical protein
MRRHPTVAKGLAHSPAYRCIDLGYILCFANRTQLWIDQYLGAFYPWNVIILAKHKLSRYILIVRIVNAVWALIIVDQSLGPSALMFQARSSIWGK